MDNSTPRVQVINSFLSKRQNSRYLEIGIRNANTLFKIKASEKVGVDPINQISKKNRLLSYFQPFNRHISYHWKTSDEFFKNRNESELFDFIFIDGLHTHTQSYLDVINSLKMVKDDGLIMLHDCHPKHPIAAYPTSPYSPDFSTHLRNKLDPEQIWDGAWNGDVWKTILQIRSEFPVLSVMVLDTDHGLGLISKKGNLPYAETLKNRVKNIEKLEFEDLDKNRTEWMNLRAVDSFNNWENELN